MSRLKEYTVIYEHAADNWSAYVPDLPGCIATAATREETEQNFARQLSSISRGCGSTAQQSLNHRS